MTTVRYSESLYNDYMKILGDPHGVTNPWSINWLDLRLREAIGKTDDIKIPMCSHMAIINREFSEQFCRVCNKDLSIIGVGRWNDYLVLRHPQCTKPICLNCSRDNPDEFHIAFRKGLEKLGLEKDVLLKEEG